MHLSQIQQCSCYVTKTMHMIFPLLFPSGDLVWTPSIFQTGNNKTKQTSVLQYYAYYLMHRDTGKFNPIYYIGTLHQHYVIHAYIQIKNQSKNFNCNLHYKDKLRVKYYHGLMNCVPRTALNNPKKFQNQAKLDNIFVLYYTFIGIPRHMLQLYQDAMAVLRKCGRPGLFVIITYNPGWPEIKRALNNFQQIKKEPYNTPLLIISPTAEMQRHCHRKRTDPCRKVSSSSR